MHKNYRPFDDGHEVRGVFLDISKAFDRVCHEGLLLKLQQKRDIARSDYSDKRFFEL